MKRYLITISCLLCAVLLLLGVYYAGGFYLALGEEDALAVPARTAQGDIELYTADGWTRLELRGVNLGSSLPGTWATDYAPDRETYLRWFGQMSELGANVIRVYSVQSPVFYRALDDYNKGAQSPLYLLQGVWVGDYAQNSHMDAFDRDYCQKLIDDCKVAVDALHGKRFILANDASANGGFFLRDVSRWVLGYIIGGEWTDVTVAYTDEKYPELQGYDGEYLYTAEEASPFETMLAQAGDTLIAYETSRYAQQHLISFANGKTTDPFDYPQEIAEFFRKCASIDAEHIRARESFRAGVFASYSVYAHDLDYLAVMDPAQWHTLCDKEVTFADCDGTQGEMNTYLAYLKLLNAHHSMPVVALEFGAAGGRGLAQYNSATALHQGNLSEKEQGELAVSCWENITRAGCAGGCVFSWQDEWHKRTWNTMFAIDTSRSPYWSDAQSSDQHFGLLAFDPGEESVCVVDGVDDEWSEQDVIIRYDDASSVSLKYDERYIYLRIYKPGFSLGSETLFIPIDVTQKTGATAAPAYNLRFEKAVDFIVRLRSADDAAVLVQDRYHAIHANFEAEITGEDAYIDPPAKDSTHFEVVRMAVKDTVSQYWDMPATLIPFDTGKLRYGNADPASPDYDSLADFAANGEVIELRLPWGLLNFSDPSRMQIHDDYYDGNYGVEFISLREFSVGLGTYGQTIKMGTAELDGWGNDVKYHERLKSAYYALQSCWTGGEAA